MNFRRHGEAGAPRFALLAALGVAALLMAGLAALALLAAGLSNVVFAATP